MTGGSIKMKEYVRGKLNKVAFKAFWFLKRNFLILAFIPYIKDKEFCVTIDQ